MLLSVSQEFNATEKMCDNSDHFCKSTVNCKIPCFGKRLLDRGKKIMALIAEQHPSTVDFTSLSLVSQTKVAYKEVDRDHQPTLPKTDVVCPILCTCSARSKRILHLINHIKLFANIQFVKIKTGRSKIHLFCKYIY